MSLVTRLSMGGLAAASLLMSSEAFAGGCHVGGRGIYVRPVIVHHHHLDDDDHDDHDDGPGGGGQGGGQGVQGGGQGGRGGQAQGQGGRGQGGMNQGQNGQVQNGQNGQNQNGQNQNQNGQNQVGQNQNRQNQNQNGQVAQIQNGQNQNQDQNIQNQNGQNQNGQNNNTAAVQVPSGSQITLTGDFGAQGQVYLNVNNVKLPLTVDQWTATEITLTLPAVQLSQAQSASIDVVPKGGQSDSIAITLNPKARLVVNTQSAGQGANDNLAANGAQ